MSQTADKNYIFNAAVCRITIALYHSMKAFQEFNRIDACPAWLIFIQCHWMLPIASALINPHVGFLSCLSAILMQYLTWNFVCVNEVSSEFLMQPAVNRLQIFKSSFDKQGITAPTAAGGILHALLRSRLTR